MNRIDGLDVSSIQYINNNGKIDYEAVKKAGYDFVYIQSSRYSSTLDYPFETMARGFNAAGVLVGPYHFCYQGSDPIKQMAFYYEACEGWGSQEGQLPPMIDWEFCHDLTPKACVEWLVAAAKEAERLWYPKNAELILAGRKPRKPVIYTFPDFANNRHGEALQGALELGQYPLAWAAYKSTTVPWKPTDDQEPEVLGNIYRMPSPWKESRWTFWQYSFKGPAVPGLLGDVDRDLFHGSTGDLQELAGIYKVHTPLEYEDKP